MDQATPAAPARVMSVPGRGLFPTFPQCNGFFVGNGLFQNILRGVPCALLYLAEMPGMTFAAGKVAP